jgi:4'-phosphopantetheinyl transferase
MPDAELIAETHFAAGERDQLRRLEPSQVDAGFFRCWTRKEAYIKALGGGLSIPLDGFEVTLAPDDSRLVHIGGDRTVAGEWALPSCVPAPGFVGAVAIHSPAVALTCWRWE